MNKEREFSYFTVYLSYYKKLKGGALSNNLRIVKLAIIEGILLF